MKNHTRPARRIAWFFFSSCQAPKAAFLSLFLSFKRKKKNGKENASSSMRGLVNRVVLARSAGLVCACAYAWADRKP